MSVDHVWMAGDKAVFVQGAALRVAQTVLVDDPHGEDSSHRLQGVLVVGDEMVNHVVDTEMPRWPA